MKVLLINNFLYRKGGSESVFFNTANLLCELGHEVVFFSRSDEKNITTDTPVYLINRPHGKFGKLTELRNHFSNPDAAQMLDKILKKEKPDIAHVHLFWGGISPSIFAVLKKHGVPLVHTAHDYRMVCPAYAFRNGKGDVCERCKGGHFIQCFINRCSKGNALESLIMAIEMYSRNRKWHPAKELDGIIYVSNFSKQKHETIDPLFASTKNIVLYNCTDIGKKFPPIQKDGGYYLYYGRLSFEKGIPTLLRVFAKHPELTLKVVGTGPLEEELKAEFDKSEPAPTGALAQPRKRYENIQFLGYHSGDTLAELVRNARYVCVPSECYENNPMTVVEAYSMGVPVIGARIGGIPEIVDEGATGFLFESGDVESLEQVIAKSRSVNDEDYANMKRNAKQFAKEHFDTVGYVEKLVAFYESIINRKEG